MSRFVCAASLFLFGVLLFSSVRAEEPAREFLDGLRSRGYLDAAMDYLDEMQSSSLAPTSLREAISFEKSLVLIDLSRTQRDRKIRREKLSQAQSLLDDFIRTKTDHPKANAARSTLGTLFVERARMRFGDSKSGDDSGAAAESRKLYEQSFAVFADLQKQVDQELSKIPVALDTRDRKQAALIARRKQLRADFLQTELLAAAIREELADHLTEGGEDQKKFLAEAAQMYDGIYKKYRTRVAGLYARMYQGRCNRRMGKTKDALGYFTELLAQPSEPESMLKLKAQTLRLALETWLLPSERKYFEAIRRANEWLDESPKQKSREPDWLAIRFHLARAYKMQVDEGKLDGSMQRGAIVRTLETARKHAQFVAAEQGDYQEPARKLLRQLGGPNMTEDGPTEPANFQEAFARGKQNLDALSATTASLQKAKQQLGSGTGSQQQRLQEVDQLTQKRDQAADDAIKFYRLALELADAETPQSNVNLTQYFLCYVYYVRQDYYDAALVGEFVATRYPASPGAKQCAKIATACYLKIKEQIADEKSSFATDRLYDMGQTMFANWPVDAETQATLKTLVPHLINAGRIDRATEFVDMIPKSAAELGNLELITGQAAWGAVLEGKQQLRESKNGVASDGESASPTQQELDELLQQARRLLTAGWERLPSDVQVDQSLALAALSLAQVHADDGNPAAAIKVLEHPQAGPLTLARSKNPVATQSVFLEETYRTALRSYVASVGDGDAAVMQKAKEMIVEMRQVFVDDTAAQQRVMNAFIGLSRDIETKMNSSQPSQREQLSKVYETFLTELSRGSTDGNTLNWVAGTLFSLGSGFDEGAPLNENAKGYYQKAQAAYENALAANPNDRLAVPTRMRLATIAEKLGDYAGAIQELKVVLRTNSRAINVQLTAARTLQAWASVDPKQNAVALAGSADKIVLGWEKLAAATLPHKQYRETFYESCYQAEVCRLAMAAASPADAKQLVGISVKRLKRILILYAGMNDQWKSKFDGLLKEATSRQ